MYDDQPTKALDGVIMIATGAIWKRIGPPERSRNFNALDSR